MKITDELLKSTMTEFKKSKSEGITENWKKVTESYLNLKGEKEMKPADLPFERALELIKEGFRLSRKGWNGSNQYVFLMDGYPEGVPANQALSKRSGIKEGRTVIVILIS
ncbi:MAG: DUF2829 domain-containing protein [Candidatus Cloacimonetes bacterium]|nr:DUF2829 domain-containing protein [Candidatus Cloacimonadota bacterium]